MKRSNVKVGEFIEAKVTVLPYHIAGESYEVVKVEPLDYDGAYFCQIATKGMFGQPYNKWVEPAAFRKPRTKAPTIPVAPVLTDECTPHNLQVGDKVLVGSEGAGYFNVLVEYADLTCTVTKLNSNGTVDILHPDVQSGHSYTSNIKHLTKVVPEPTITGKLVPQNVRQGVKVGCTEDFTEPCWKDAFKAGTVYTVLRNDIADDGNLLLKHPSLGCGKGYGKVEKFVLLEEPAEVVTFQEGDVLECTEACTGEHDEKAVKGRLYRFGGYTYATDAKIYIHDPDLWLNHAVVSASNFKLYARPIKDSNAVEIK